MTPEEKFNQQVWEILKKIKENGLATEKNKPVKFKFGHFQGAGIIPRERKENILLKLQELRALRVRDRSEPPIPRDDEVYLDLIQPKFGEVYDKYQKKCDLNSYFTEDEKTQKILAKQRREQSIRPTNFTPRSIPLSDPSAEEVFKTFSTQNYNFVLTIIRSILSLIDFSPNGEIHYQLQSPSGQLLINERSLLNKLEVKGLMRSYGEDGIFGIATLGNINVSVLRNLESYLINAKEQSKTETVQKSPDLKQRYDQLLDEIKSIHRSPDLEERYKKQLEEIRSNQPSPINTSQPLTTKIEITSMPELQIKGFEEKVVLQKPKNKRIQLRKFPLDLRWEEITIKFLNGHEVIIKARKEIFQTTYETMGFQDEKQKLPNKQWQFLKGLSETSGEISWDSPRATAKGKKQKQLLAETLKAYFQIGEDPFFPYKQEKSYKIRINLIPEASPKPNSSKRGVIEDEDRFGFNEFYKEEAPVVSEVQQK